MTSTSWNENSSGVVAPKQKCPPSGVGVGGGGGGVWIFSGKTHCNKYCNECI